MSLLNPLRSNDEPEEYTDRFSEYGTGGSSSIPKKRGDEYSKEVELLKKSGIIKTADGIEGHFLGIMDSVGLDARSVLARIAIIMDSGETDSVKLTAAKIALQLHMHPAMVAQSKSETKTAPNITFLINSPQVNMQNVLVPGAGSIDVDSLGSNLNQTKESW